MKQCLPKIISLFYLSSRQNESQIILICRYIHNMIQAFERLSLTSTQYYSQISSQQVSQRLVEKARPVKIDSLFIYNFKSFKNKVYVGPFMQFTSIIGPNGAGKSNILDAMMFCFCNEKNKLQFYDIRQFISRQGKETYKEMSNKNKHCYVQVTFRLEDNSKLSLKRTLYANQNQVFQIDGQQYSQKIYQNYLIKCNINYISSNYAIWQGQIDKILLKNPKDLTNYIETISGSLFFKKDQQSKQNSLLQAEKQLQLKAQRLLKLKQQKKKIKKNHQNKSNSQALQKEYEEILTKILLIKIYFSNKEIKQFQKQIQAKQKQQKDRIKQINEIKSKMQEEQGKKRNLQESKDVLMKQIAQLNIQLKNIDNNTSIIDLQTLKQLQTQLQDLNKYKKVLQTKLAEKQKQNLELPSADINKEYLDLYSRWEKDNQTINKELSKRKQQYLYVQGLLQSKKVIIQEYEQKQEKNMKNNQLSENVQRQLASNIEEIQKNINKLKIEKSKTLQDCQKGKLKMDELSREILAYNQKLIELGSIIDDSIENDKDKDLVHQMKGIQGFKGIVEQWVKPANKKYQVCYQIMMGKILKYMLCLDEGASKHISIKLKQNGQIRNLVILNNISQKSKDSNKYQIVRNDIGKLGQLAIQAIEYDKSIPNFEVFLKDFLGNKVICQNLNKAWQILGKNIKGINQIYTLDGNFLRADGIISSFGSVESVKTKYKYLDVSKNRSTILGDMKKHQNEKRKLEEEFDQLKRKFGDECMQRLSLQLQKLESRKQQLTEKLAFLKQNTQKKQLKIPKGLEDELSQLNTRKSKLQIDIKDIQSKMMNNKIFKNFVEKNKIENLQSFRAVQNFSSLENLMRTKNNLAKQRQTIEQQLNKTLNNLAQKQAKYNKINQKVQSVKNYESRQSIVQNLRTKENELNNFKQTLSKMNNFNAQNLKFKSQLPSLKTKLSLMIQRSDRSIKEELHTLGLNELPDESSFANLEEDLGTSIERASRRNIEQTQENLQKERLDLQKKLQQLNIQAGHNPQQNQADIDNEIDQINKFITSSNQNIRVIKEELQQVKKNRKQLFVQFINDLKPILQETYAILTENNDGIPGRIDLYMENQAFPCDDGLYYYPTPPTKRFVYDLDQLSGGQKSIASLALQYSIAMTSKSIFLMLDEIDAFLDKFNVEKFLKLIRNSMQKKSIQFILVTHKKGLFLNGLSLVGITKPLQDPFSKAYSMKLQEDEYDESSKASSSNQNR